MATGKHIAYYRVSTNRQGESGLGLEAQRKSVMDFLNGGQWSLVEEYTEVESGKRADRPELAKALAACRLHKATLTIAKLDRLARNVAFTSNLMEAGVEFVAVDFPQANRLTIHILAAVAEHEASAISARTKAALAAAKARGVKLGNPDNLTDDAREKGRQAAQRARQEAARKRAADVKPAIAGARLRGAKTLAQIAGYLNRAGITAPRGGKWTPTQVARVQKATG